jgi:hypothetical protein
VCASASPKRIEDQASTAMHKKMVHQNFNSTANIHGHIDYISHKFMDALIKWGSNSWMH